MNNSIEGIVGVTLDRLKEVADVNTVIGAPISTGQDCTIIPVSRVGFGFGVGGGEYDKEKEPRESYPFLGGSGAGISINPIGFLIVKKEGVSMLPAETSCFAERLAEMLPNLVSTVKNAMCEKAKPCEEGKENGKIHY